MDTIKLPDKWLEHDRKVKPYIWSHRITGYLHTALGLGCLVYLFLQYRGLHFEWWLKGYVSRPILLWLGYFGIIGAAWKVLSLPFSTTHHLIEKKYGLSKQAFLPWLWDYVKACLLGAVLGSVALGIVIFCLYFFGDLWWFPCATFLVLFSILLAELTPVLLIPIFYKLKPLEDGPLKQRLLALTSKFGIQVRDVYHLGLGEKTEKGNAAFVGLGKTKRILIGDTLYTKHSPEEVEAVFAHELGHQVHNDLWKGIGVSTFFLYVGFFVAQWVAKRLFGVSLDTQIDSPFNALIFFVTLSVIQMPFGVAQSWYSRSRERMADFFAAEVIGVGKALADSLEKLTFQNYSFFKPNPILEFLNYSHPAPWRRITSLKK